MLACVQVEAARPDTSRPYHGWPVGLGARPAGRVDPRVSPGRGRGTPRNGRRPMRNLLALIGLVVVGFGGIGWYLGWYHLSVAKGPEGTVEIKVDVDSKKVADDASQKLN